MANTIQDNIKNWLGTKGYPFEIDCARKLQNNGFKIQPAVHYFDKDIQVYREVDFCAFKQLIIKDFSFNLTLIVECKSSETPWIVFASKSRHTQAEFLQSLIINTNGNEFLSKIDINDKSTFCFSHDSSELMGYNFVRMEKRTGDKDAAHEALMQSSKASLVLKDQGNQTQTKFCNIYIPVVVADKQVFMVSDSGVGSEPNVNEISYCKHGRIYAFQKQPLLVHHIVAGSFFDEYCKKVSSDFEHFFSKYQSEIMKIALNQPSNSVGDEFIIY